MYVAMIRRLCAMVLAALVLLEGAGVARALASAGEWIECCCGRHDSHRACRCKACPVSKRRAHAATTRLDQPRECDGDGDPGVLAVTALPIVALQSISLSFPAIVLELPAVRPLLSRIVEAGRPPP
jgi:hypothetical protein